MTLKIAVVGTGKVARNNYVPYLASQPDVELAYWNRTPETAQLLAESYQGRTLPSLASVADWKPTSVLVLTSEKARYAISMELLKLGVPRLFFEKPLVAMDGQAHVTEEDFEKGKALLTLAKARATETAIVFNYRFFDQTVAAERAVKERKLGEVINFTALVHYACWSHCIDLLHLFAGSAQEIAALSGDTRQSPELRVAAKDVCAALRMGNGATGTLIGTAGLKWQQPLYELVLTFENGRIHMRDLDGTLEIMDGATRLHECQSIVRDSSRWDQYKASFANSLDAYLRSLRESTPPPIPALDGLRELQVEAALKRSIAQRRPVLVQQEFPIDGL